MQRDRVVTGYMALFLVAAAMLGASSAAKAVDYRWLASGGVALGCNGQVHAIQAMPDGSTYVGGRFTQCGSTQALNIARWDGSQWSALGAGVAYTVWGFANHGGQLVVGTSSRGLQSCLITWDGTQFANMGTLDPCTAYAVLSSSSGLFAAGGVFARTGTPLGMVVRWNGSEFQPAGDGLATGIGGVVFSLGEHAGEVYAGGFFGLPSGNNLSRFTGSGWTSVGHPGSTVGAISSFGGSLHVGYSGFGVLGATPIARRVGQSWSQIPQLTGFAADMVEHQGVLAVAGVFPELGSLAASWDGFSAGALDQTPSGAANSIASIGPELWLGGSVATGNGFTGTPARKLNNAWIATGSSNDAGARGRIYGFAQEGNRIYAAGEFDAIGAVAARNVAYFENGTWHPLGTGVNGAIKAIAVNQGVVYVTGRFTAAGGNPANNLARYRPAFGWDGLGSGLDGGGPFGSGSALTWFQGQLYVGGSFSSVDGVAAEGLASWDGANWRAQPGIADATTIAFAVSGGQLYAGGAINVTGDLTLHTLIRLNGTQWTSVPSTTDGGLIRGLTAYGGDLVAVGTFATINNVAVRGVARWNGAAWTALPNMFGVASLEFEAVAASGPILCVGGRHTAYTVEHQLSCYDGSNWQFDTADGIGDAVSAVMAVGDDFWVGGRLYHAGGHASSGYARLQVRTFADGFE